MRPIFALSQLVGLKGPLGVLLLGGVRVQSILWEDAQGLVTERPLECLQRVIILRRHPAKQQQDKNLNECPPTPVLFSLIHLKIEWWFGVVRHVFCFFTPISFTVNQRAGKISCPCNLPVTGRSEPKRVFCLGVRFYNPLSRMHSSLDE